MGECWTSLPRASVSSFLSFFWLCVLCLLWFSMLLLLASLPIAPASACLSFASPSLLFNGDEPVQMADQGTLLSHAHLRASDSTNKASGCCDNIACNHLRTSCRGCLKTWIPWVGCLVQQLKCHLGHLPLMSKYLALLPIPVSCRSWEMEELGSSG